MAHVVFEHKQALLHPPFHPLKAGLEVTGGRSKESDSRQKRKK